MIADASTLYNAGTAALEQGRMGEAVAFLTAAQRLDPRAADISRNLGLAEARVHAGRGDDAGPARLGSPMPTLSIGEAWWLAALLLAVAAVVHAAGAFRSRTTPPLGARAVAIMPAALGSLLVAWLAIVAFGERAHPEAVVVAPLLEARRGADEAQGPPVLLRAGERVRLGRSAGADVEVRLGGTSIGWATREGLWRVSDAPRYTSEFKAR